jgi:WD40 repeat protein
LGWNRGQGRRLEREGFKFYEIERVGEKEFDLYKTRIARYEPRAAYADRPQWFGEKNRRPDTLHVLCMFPKAADQGTEFGIFQEVVRTLLDRDYSKLPDAVQDKLGNQEAYQSVMTSFLGGRAMRTLGLNPPDDPNSEGFDREPWPEVLTDFCNVLARQRNIKAGKWSEVIIGGCSFVMFPEKEHQKELQFVDDDYLAYFAAKNLLLRRAVAAKATESQVDVYMNRLQTWPRLSQRAAEFFGGAISEKTLEELLLRAILATHDPARDPATLVQSIHSICRGANSSFAVPRALLAGHALRGWHSLDDPILLSSELHGLLMDQTSSPVHSSELKKFAESLVLLLKKEGRPWLQRVSPFPMDAGLTTEHDARVTAVFALADGRIVSGDAIGVVLVWNWKAGTRVHRKLHDGPIRALAEVDHRRHRCVVSAGDDRTVRLWCPDREGARVITQPRPHQGKVLALAVVGAGSDSRVISAGEDGRLYVWSLSLPENCPPPAHGHLGSVRYLCALKNTPSPQVVSAGDDGYVRLWSIDSDRLTLLHQRRVPAESRRVTALAGDSVHIVWGDELGRVFTIGTDGWQDPQIHVGHSQAVTALLILDDGFVSGGQDGRVFQRKWYDMRSPSSQAEATPIRALCNVDHQILCGLENGSLRTFSGDRFSPLPVANHPGRLNFLQATAIQEERAFVSAGERLLRVGTFKDCVEPLSTARSRVVTVALGTDFAVSGGSDGSVTLFDGDLRAGLLAPRRSWPGHHDGRVTSVKASKGLFVTAGKDGKVCVWERDGESFVLREVWRDASVTSLCVTSEAIIWSSEDGQVLRGNLACREPVLLWKGDGSAVTALDVRKPSARQQSDLHVAAGTSSGKICWLDAHLSTPHPIIDLKGPIIALRWFTDNEIAVATKEYAKVINLNNPHLPPVTVHFPEVSTLACSCDGLYIAFGTQSGAVRVVEISRRRAFDRQRQLHRNKVIALQFATDRVFLSASRDGIVKIARIGENDLEVLGGCPVGGQITAMDFKDDKVLLGLAGGGHVALNLHLPVDRTNG